MSETDREKSAELRRRLVADSVARLALSDRGRKSLVHLQRFLNDCGIGLDPTNWQAVVTIMQQSQVVPGTVLEFLAPYREQRT